MYEGSCWSEQTDLTAVDLKFNILLHQFVPTNTHFDVNLLLVCNLQCLMGVGSHYWTLAAIFVSMIAAKSLIGWALFRIMGSVVFHRKFLFFFFFKWHWNFAFSEVFMLKTRLLYGVSKWDFYFQNRTVALYWTFKWSALIGRGKLTP